MDEATKCSLMRENEAAETIAKNGYNIEQKPVIEGTTRNPDYIIEGLKEVIVVHNGSVQSIYP